MGRWQIVFYKYSNFDVKSSAFDEFFDEFSQWVAMRGTYVADYQQIRVTDGCVLSTRQLL